MIHLKTPTTRTRGRTWLRIEHTHPPSTFDSHGFQRMWVRRDVLKMQLAMKVIVKKES